MLVWLSAIVTTALLSPFTAVISMNRFSTPFARVTLHIFCSRSSLVFSTCSGLTDVRTSSSFEASPPTAPRIALVSIPFMFPVDGTVTPLTFFIMFPLQCAVIESGISPSTSLAFAAAYAIAIGSVHPSAGTSSSLSISMKFSNMIISSCIIYSCSLMCCSCL